MKIHEAIELMTETLEGARIYGNEIVSECPFCESDKKKFYVNIRTGQYSCKRASCSAHGNLTTLFKHFKIEETIEYEDETYNAKKERPKLNFDQSTIVDLKEEHAHIIEYMMGRGITHETLTSSGVMYSPRHNAMVFLTRNNKREIVGVLYRTADKRLFMERGSEQKLWGTEYLNYDVPTLYITEGHIDMLTLREMGVENAVSMPNGATSHDWIDRDWELLNKFERIVLCYDNDPAGKKGFLEVKGRLDFANIYELDYGSSNDINDMFMENYEGLAKTVREPREVSFDGFISLEGVSTESGVQDELLSTGLNQLDQIFGGIGLHQSSIICAESGAGKSTVISNMVKGILAMGEKAVIWSGELSNRMLKVWLYSAIGGEQAIDVRPHPFRKQDMISSIKPDYEKKIDKAVSGRLFVYDGNKSNAYDMIKHFEKLHKRHGVKYFFIDNLSILDMNIKGMGQYEAESEFSKIVASFTRNNPVHLFLVAHPTKTAINTDPNFVDKSGRVKQLERYTQQQVRGSATLVNLIHNVLFLSRAKEHEKAYYCQAMENQLQKAGKTSEIAQTVKKIQDEFSLLAYLVKNRSGGIIYEPALFGYDKKTRRIYGLNSKQEDLSVEILKDEDFSDGVIELNNFEYSDF